MTDDEKALCLQAIKEYKQIRPIVQFGDLYRLVASLHTTKVADCLAHVCQRAEDTVGILLVEDGVVPERAPAALKMAES